MSEKVNFLEGFKVADIKKSAKLDIKPRLTIENLGVENGVNVEILTMPYIITIPEGKRMTPDGKVWMIDLLYEAVHHSFIAQAGSFRYQLGVLAEKHFEGKDIQEKLNQLVGCNVRIWKEIGVIEKYGESELYQVALLATP